jgi:hypothetical protein
MDSQSLERTRLALHGVAELVLAGPQYAANNTVRLRVTPGGFGTVTTPDLRVDGLELVTPTTRHRLVGTFAELARGAGVEARPLRDVYSGGPDIGVDDPVDIDPEAASLLLRAWADGDAALRTFAPDVEPVLWPEHFDVAITVAEVNYGVSPGDVHVAEPYAYVGPWNPRVGSFWNTGFGAARPLSDLAAPDALPAFFEEGARRALADPPASSS